jgi:hypothetical protein
MLPKGKTLNQASDGFRNQGQFLAALNVSRNLGIPFDALKTDMTQRHLSLGQSIQDLKSSASSTVEARRAETEADRDIRNATTTTPSMTRTTRKTSNKNGASSERSKEHSRSVAQQIAANAPLASKVRALLPSGMNLQQSASGFRSERQFLSALHASKDLGIPFAQLQAEMTGADHDSLSRAIHELKPTVDAAAAARTARHEAAADLRSTTPTTTAPTPTTTTQKAGNPDGGDE